MAKISKPIELNDKLMGTLSISISVQRETVAQADRMGIDAVELANIVEQRLQEIASTLFDGFDNV